MAQPWHIGLGAAWPQHSRAQSQRGGRCPSSQTYFRGRAIPNKIISRIASEGKADGENRKH